MNDLTHFLLARIAEKEARSGEDSAALAECEATRRILALHEQEAEYDALLCPHGAEVRPAGPMACRTCAMTDCGDTCETVALLALPYVDHPEYPRHHLRIWISAPHVAT